MRNVLLYAKDFGALIVHHTEDPHLTEGAVMNAGEVATRLGLPGVNKAAETIVLERDVRLVEITGGRYHASTLSCAESLAVIRSAKAAQAARHLRRVHQSPHPQRERHRPLPHLLPRLRRRCAPRTTARPWCAALAAGDIDVIVSSHDPQDADTKRHPFAEAADGAIGLETLLAAALRLHHNGEIGLMPLIRAMTINPAKLLGLPAGRLEKGAPADLVLVDLGQPWVVDRDLLRARSKNSPFDESKMQGRVLHTMVAGNTVYQYAAGRSRLTRATLEYCRWASCSPPTHRSPCCSAICWARSRSACC